MKHSADICEICLKHTAPTWIGVKSDSDWCVCTRIQNPNTGLFDHSPDLMKSADKERSAFATMRHIKGVVDKAVIGGAVKDIRFRKPITVVDKIPGKTMILCAMPDGKNKWYRGKAIKNLRVVL